jgi:hypothetical protein
MGWFESRQGGGLKVVTWADGTDEEIAAMLEAHYNGDIDIHDYWTVGDQRTVTLSAMAATGVYESHVQQNVVFVLSNVGGKTLSDGVTECAFQVDQLNLLKEKGNMNSSNTNKDGWKNCARRTWCNNVYKDAIPSTLRGIFKEFTNRSGKGGGSEIGTYATTDTFALRAEIEIFGSVTNSFSGEGSQVKWYETVSNRIKKADNSAVSWWGRSAASLNGSAFCLCNSDGRYSISANAGAIIYGIAPFGVI